MGRDLSGSPPPHFPIKRGKGRKAGQREGLLGGWEINGIGDRGGRAVESSEGVREKKRNSECKKT